MKNQLPEILEAMLEYVRGCGDMSYFEEICKTGLFHDTCGEIVDMTYKNNELESVTVTEEY